MATAGNIGKDLHREIVIVIKYEVKGTENFKTVMISLSRGYTSALRKYDAIMHPHDSGYTHSERVFSRCRGMEKRLGRNSRADFL